FSDPGPVFHTIVSIKNDGHYFCRAGGNRPDGLNEPVTYYVPAQVRRLPSFHTEASSNENQKYSRYLPCDIILQLPGI
ncbi:hypothetical protein QS766_24840, partial [Escherichia coli]|nr:hypothetical protein [Escherichia coli]